MRKIILTALILTILAGCAKESDSSINPTSNPVTETQDSALKNDSDKPSLPNLSQETAEEIAEGLGLEPEALSNKTPEIPDIEALISNLPPASEPSPEAKEAMNPNSTKDCNTYEAQILKDICYNARGLSDNSNDQSPNSQ